MPTKALSKQVLQQELANDAALAHLVGGPDNYQDFSTAMLQEAKEQGLDCNSLTQLQSILSTDAPTGAQLAAAFSKASTGDYNPDESTGGGGSGTVNSGGDQAY